MIGTFLSSICVYKGVNGKIWELSWPLFGFDPYFPKLVNVSMLRTCYYVNRQGGIEIEYNETYWHMIYFRDCWIDLCLVFKHLL